ncbi:hypothetical protein K8O68_07435 [Salipaludibacillus sp. CUR1]|uniref:hypothetical protein n=1 Tax=Salipaludibacillus sp. CUR1 TaxID=2820003 RepID=UPI001E3D5763|nr:hypothetical protein [Salipaludibacillus sp. CUR1]MCE7792258.1 hypothetical protein [Salipaludibacillus sp. CUR1]
MADNKKSEKGNSDSPEQKFKEKDPKRDLDPQREVADKEKNKDNSEKNPDDFEGKND